MTKNKNFFSEGELYAQLLLVQTENIGIRTANKLINHFELASNIFKSNKKSLSKLPFLSDKQVESLRNAANHSDLVKKEIEFIAKNNIKPYFFSDENYPQKLALCNDAPIMIFQKGEINLNKFKTITIIGTRKNTPYGTQLTKEFVEGLQHIKDLSIISGLAYGIDILAHKTALQCNIPTVGVLAHSLDIIYPPIHESTAKEMIKNGGGVITEYFSNTKPDKQNFPMRNRIAAGVSDVTVVIETDVKGGSMITAKLAASYNRDVAAFPGRVNDIKSKGCNYLIANNIAQLITSAEDLIDLMNWNKTPKPKISQSQLFHDFSPNETLIFNTISEHEDIDIDTLQLKVKLDNSELAGILLQLELNGILLSLPGKRFRLA